MPTGIELIAEERLRQVSEEGWTPEHDAEHVNGELADAAACYAATPDFRDELEEHTDEGLADLLWPWDASWWKPSPDDRVRELVKAGALIAAEIDRLQRL